MPPNEYIQIDSVLLGATYGSTPWWCDFDVSGLPTLGLRVTKGAPSIPIPHADEDLPVAVHGGTVDFTLLGVVYGDFNQSGAPVSTFENQRLQLVDNLETIMALTANPGGDGTRTLTYHIYNRAYTADVTVIGTQGGTVGPLERSPTDPLTQSLALKLSIAAGALALTGS